jgi:YD repeat-containing protein
MHMTIAQQLNIQQFPFSIKNEAGQEIYCEYENGYWFKREYNSKNGITRYEDSDGDWRSYEYDAQGNMICVKDANGYWDKREYNADGKETRLETFSGFCSTWEYDANGNDARYKTSDGYWEQWEYDADGVLVYHETSELGVQFDKRK